MQWTPQHKIRLAFWVLAIMPVVLCVFAVRNTGSLIDAAEDVHNANLYLRTLESFRSLANEVEVAQREYVVTGDETYLQPYTKFRTQIDQRLQRLKDLSRNDQHRLRYLDALQDLVPQKFEEMQKTIETRRNEGVEAATRQLLTDRGRQAMDDIRHLVDSMLTQEDMHLGDRERDQRRTFIRTLVIFASALMLSFLFVVFLRFVLKSEDRERAREEERIRQLNAELEQKVEQRTRELRRSNEDLQQFAYIASHDLQEPLRMVASYTELLKRLHPDSNGGDRSMEDKLTRVIRAYKALKAAKMT